MSQLSVHPVREEELKNRVATVYFGKYDCTRIVGNIDFCVSPKRHDPRQMTLMPEAPILWAEAKNHPTDICRMLAQLILTIKVEQKGGLDAYAAFWRRYKRPPKREYWDFIVSRLDLLVPQDVRERKRSASGKEQMNATSSDATYNALLAALRSAHRVLATQIEPKVYEYGFLKV